MVPYAPYKMNPLSRVKTHFLDLLFPPSCAGCKKAGTFLCNTCIAALTCMPPACFVCQKIVPATWQGRIPPGRTCMPCRRHTAIYAFFSPLSYQDKTIREAIHRFKYRRAREFDRIFARLLLSSVNYYRILFPPDAILVPVPLHARRKRARGFNQSDVIAARLSELLTLPLATYALVRIKHTDPQAGLTKTTRLENIAGSFSVPNPAMVHKKTIILVDDVKTTGATLNEAARVLKECGAKRVWAVTIAH